MNARKSSKNSAKEPGSANDASSARQPMGTNYSGAAQAAQSWTRRTSNWYAARVISGLAKTHRMRLEPAGLSHDSKLMLTYVAKWQAKQ